MKGAFTCLLVCGIPLLATPISDQTASDTAQTVYFRLKTNPQTFAPPNENGFYTATLPRTLDFVLTLSGNALTFPGYSEGTLLHAWLILERTGPDAPVWQLTSPAGGTAHAPALTAGALGPPVFTVSAGGESVDVAGGTVDLAAYPDLAAALAGGFTLSWQESYRFTAAGLPARIGCVSCTEIYQTQTPFGGSVHAVLEYEVAISEPATLLLAGLAMILLGFLARRPAYFGDRLRNPQTER